MEMAQTECKSKSVCFVQSIYDVCEYVVSEVSTATTFAHQVTWSVQKKLARMKQNDIEGAD
jgi:hypothetical protein